MGKILPDVVKFNSDLIEKGILDLSQRLASLTDDKKATVLDIVSKMTWLGSLYLSKNNLTYLPNEIGKLHELIVLDIDQNNFTSVPAVIFDLKNLTTLDLSDNQITTLPKEIGNLQELKTLYLDSTQLTILPHEIGTLHQLRTLYLRFNQNLKSIPITLSTIPDLKLFISRANLQDYGQNPFELGQDQLYQYFKNRVEFEDMIPQGFR